MFWSIGRMAAVSFLAAVLLFAQGRPAGQSGDVTRATLDNGMRVVILRNPLAPVVTVEQNYLVGGDETPQGFPGMAHAQEHMAFRGCAELSGDQISAIFAQLGGFGNADTQQSITQYYTTLPAGDLDIALRVDAACMQDIQDSQAEWAQEKGAIEQEVARDLSNPTYKFITRANEDMFSGTPYSHDPLGTKDSFDATSGEMLKNFYKAWYAPNNAILVIAGDVEPSAVLAKVKEYYGKIERKALPPRPQVSLNPVKSESFTLDSNLPYLLAFIAYRMPGTDSADFAAVHILSDVLASQRGNLYELVPQGKALEAEFGLAEAYPKASMAYSVAVLPAAADAAPVIQDMRKIIADYAAKGVPADLVEAAKRREIAAAEFRRDSIPGLAEAWSDALAAEGRNSPDDDVEAMKRVTVEDVNRLAKTYLVDQGSITAQLKPSPSGEPVASNGFGGAEQLTSAPTKAVELPSWASSRLLTLELPPPQPAASDVTLPNGLRLIVRTVKVTPTVTVVGNVRHDPQMETPSGRDGVARVLENLFSYGTKNLDRLAFQKALDDIAAEESAGFEFSLQVLKQDFTRGVQLLADNELNPALPNQAFNVLKPQTAQFVAGQLRSPGYRAGHALNTALFPAKDPVLRQATPETVSSLTIDDIRQYYAKTIRPDLTTIVVIGDITPEEARSAIEKSFGEWKTDGPKPEVDLPRVPPNKPSAENVPDPTQIQDSVNLSETIPITRFDSDYYPLQLGNHVLGGGFYATRLYHDLRQVAGYVYNVEVVLNAMKTRTIYTVAYGCDPQNVSKARQLIERDLVAMQKEAVTPAELQQAKALLLRQLPLAESSEDGVANALVRRAEIGLPLDEPERAAKRFYGLTADDVRAAFAKWIRPDDFVQIVRGPAPQ
ncbi:MAG TPA: pitrilysin family protein [Rugosimonospora sp.]|nr:pitrilysin family protein [Rugosimonospora sp.]